MPSSAKQRIITLNRKDRKTKGSVILIKKTGYLNLTVNGRHYYYNYAEHYKMDEKIDIEKIMLRQRQKQQSKKRQTILITKKGG